MNEAREICSHGSLRNRKSQDASEPDQTEPESEEVDVGPVLAKVVASKCEGNREALLSCLSELTEILESERCIVNATDDDVNVAAMLVISCFESDAVVMEGVLRMLAAFQKRERRICHVIPDEFVVCCLAILQETSGLCDVLMDVLTQFMMVKENLLGMIFDSVSSKCADNACLHRCLRFYLTLLKSYSPCPEQYVTAIAEFTIGVLREGNLSSVPEIPFIMHELWNNHFSLLRLPGGVECYNQLLELNGSCLYELLNDIKVCLLRENDLIEIISSGLNLRRIVCLVTDPNALIAETSITICNNLMSCGERFCRQLISLGLVDALVQLLDSSTCELTHQALLCLANVLNVQIRDVTTAIMTNPTVMTRIAETFDSLPEADLTFVISSIRNSLALLQRTIPHDDLTHLIDSSNLLFAVESLCDRSFTSQSAESAVLAFSDFLHQQ